LKASILIDKIVLIPPLGGIYGGPTYGTCPFSDQNAVNVYIINKKGEF
jgi:hypothetical protein